MKRILFSKPYIYLVFVFSILSSCKYKYVDDNAFIGKWELIGRDIYSDMKIQFIRKNDKIQGYLLSAPQNKYTQFFPDSGSVWINSVDRTSNYAFKIKEKKVASELISLYGLKGSSTFYVVFSEEKDKLFLLEKNPDPSSTSPVFYQKIH